MNALQNRLMIVVVAVLCAAASALQAQQAKESLVVGEIEVNKGIQAGDAQEFTQVLGTLKGEVNTRLSRKFKVLSRNLKLINMEKAVSGDTELAAAKFILATTITGFSDGGATNGAEAGVAYTRTIKLFGTADILKLDGETVASVPFSANLHKGKLMISGVSLDERFGDELVEDVPKTAAGQIVTGVFYYLAPPKVTDVTDKQVTIDWGEGFINKGDKFEVFALKAKQDADPVEVLVGTVEINRVNPKNATGIIAGVSPGIVEGCILRKPQ